MEEKKIVKNEKVLTRLHLRNLWSIKTVVYKQNKLPRGESIENKGNQDSHSHLT